ncbi:glycosyltransferase [Mucilaginibacter flavidus]|uniref:glycosyltransferase n=1 Tax=Mucilaginibacter flavidus TaxID=2949309 RepID=UPI002091F569|nr:glycosyltransferase [Mucilaginibacter flavidus]MCO5947676.1 glycosyltransferase family 2 protein [Mucilaginibacter flavidus]
MLSVIIPTYNPDQSRLDLTLDSLKKQTLPFDRWELIIIDNNSSLPVSKMVDLSWHPNWRIIFERRQGLTYARTKGFLEASGDILIMVDDDNMLHTDYLSHTLQIFSEYPFMGAAGGKSIPQFELEPQVWLKEFYGNLALRDLGEEILVDTWNNTYPRAAPIGAGMAIRKHALDGYISKITSNKNVIADRQGSSLSSGGDNDIVLEILKGGYQSGYFPSLTLTHIISRERTNFTYLVRLLNNMNKSWVMLLASHGICPWKKIPAWSVPLRKAKAWFTYKAWSNKVNYIRWSGACGTFDGLSEID